MMKINQVNTIWLKIKNKNVTSSASSNTCREAGLAKLCAHCDCHRTPTPASPRRHSLFLGEASPTCCQGNRRCKISMTFHFEAFKKPLKGIFKSAWEGSGNRASNYRFSTSSVLFPGYSVCSRHCLPAILCLMRHKC